MNKSEKNQVKFIEITKKETFFYRMKKKLDKREFINIHKAFSIIKEARDVKYQKHSMKVVLV